MEDSRVIVIGGGPAGLSVAHELGDMATVLERQPVVGGLCRSVERDGGVFDIGGHSFHTPHPDVFDLVNSVLDGGLYRQQRDARVYSHGVLIPYPFQQHFDRLPDSDVVSACEAGLREATADVGDADNFEDYIIRKFGRGIAEHFMLPYNRKLWARDIRAISCEWTSERVAGAKGARQKFSEDGGKRRPLQPDTLVGYPRSRGFQEIFEAMAQRVPDVRVDSDVVEIDSERKIVSTAAGEALGWTDLVSTVPLPELVRLIPGAPLHIVAAADSLQYMSLRVELILVGRRLETQLQRIYVADPDIPPHKIALNHNSSDRLRERDVHAIMAEVSISDEKAVDVDEIAPKTIDFLTTVGVLGTPDDVAWTDHLDVQYAYPVYTHDRPRLLATIQSWLAEHDIHSVGRFGSWEYVNSDRCIKMGLDLGRILRARLQAKRVPAE